jgi:hypothetical protein
LEQRITHESGSGAKSGKATLIILPVIRIDRNPDEHSGGVAPGTGTQPGRGRRRRATRS